MKESVPANKHQSIGLGDTKELIEVTINLPCTSEGGFSTLDEFVAAKVRSQECTYSLACMARAREMLRRLSGGVQQGFRARRCRYSTDAPVRPNRCDDSLWTLRSASSRELRGEKTLYKVADTNAELIEAVHLDGGVLVVIHK
jgi:hypothetical protein